MHRRCYRHRRCGQDGVMVTVEVSPRYPGFCDIIEKQRPAGARPDCSKRAGNPIRGAEHDTHQTGHVFCSLFAESSQRCADPADRRPLTGRRRGQMGRCAGATPDATTFPDVRPPRPPPSPNSSFGLPNRYYSVLPSRPSPRFANLEPTRVSLVLAPATPVLPPPAFPRPSGVRGGSCILSVDCQVALFLRSLLHPEYAASIHSASLHTKRLSEYLTFLLYKAEAKRLVQSPCSSPVIPDCRTRLALLVPRYWSKLPIIQFLEKPTFTRFGLTYAVVRGTVRLTISRR